ncbi:hypothetical protein HPX95_19645 [Bacillus tequilensis]|uniref:hypothetical protein n=1 Tax=Bacillus tequilensis TaxID=227866 RepID=UPI001575DD3A|nr:hypothetical protein [Bacillus tequilensis]NTU28353.1 hypothetical protein [Bacillus tequilensis]
MKTKKYVRIKKASVDGVWYADRIGQIFEVERLNSVSVLTNRGVHGESSVLVEDVEFIFTEKRKAEVGEKVLILDDFNEPRYMLHDVVPVIGGGDEHGVAVRKSGEWPIFLNNEQYEVIVNNEIKNEEADEMKIDLSAMGYDELIAHGEEVMRMIRIRAYGEGYKQGKFDAGMDATYMRPSDCRIVQARRDEIVEQAKADVRNLVIHGLSHYNIDCSKGNETYRVMNYNVEFITDSRERKVTALVTRRHDKKPRHVGRAKAAPSDCFNVHIGKAIALRRALGLAVPDEYLNAPQPTEVRVGDVVEGHAVKNTALVISDDAWPPISGAWVPLKYARQYKFRIIDDSREEVGGE